jgi:hypothetical protein
MKQTTIEAQNLFKNKSMATEPVNNHRASAYFTAMISACDVLCDGQPENWPPFESHLPNQAENATIGLSNELLNFKLMDQTTTPFNFLEGYFIIPESMIDALKDDLKRTKAEDLQKQNSQLYKLSSLENKLKNCLTTDLASDIETSMPTRVRNKDGRIFFIKIVSNTLSDKEAHKHIICDSVLNHEITQSNNMGAFQRELRKPHHQTIPKN